MTTLLTQQLLTELPLVQTFTYKLNQRVQLAGIYPYLFVFNMPTGTFTFTIEKTDGSFFLQKTFTSADLKASLNTTDDYFHFWFPIIPDAPMFLEKGDYTMTLEPDNTYFYNRKRFIAWIQQHENLNNTMDYTPSNDAENPLAFRLKVMKEGIL